MSGGSNRIGLWADLQTGYAFVDETRLFKKRHSKVDAFICALEKHRGRVMSVSAIAGVVYEREIRAQRSKGIEAQEQFIAEELPERLENLFEFIQARIRELGHEPDDYLERSNGYRLKSSAHAAGAPTPQGAPEPSDHLGPGIRIGRDPIPWRRLASGNFATHQIKVDFNPSPHVHPLAIQALCDQVTEHFRAAQDSPTSLPIDGQVIRLDSFQVHGFDPRTHETLLRLRFRPINYYAMLATDLRLSVPDKTGVALRARYGQGQEPTRTVPREFASVFSVALQLVTKDEPRSTIFFRRGAEMLDAGLMYQSVAECLLPDDFGHDLPAPYVAAIRGAGWEVLAETAQEQLDRLLPRSTVMFTSFGVDIERWQYSLRGIGRVQCDLEEIVNRWTRSRDQESAQIYPVTWAPDSVARFMTEEGTWTPSSAVGTYDALCADFGQDAVDRSFAGKAVRIEAGYNPPEGWRVEF